MLMFYYHVLYTEFFPLSTLDWAYELGFEKIALNSFVYIAYKSRLM